MMNFPIKMVHYDYHACYQHEAPVSLLVYGFIPLTSKLECYYNVIVANLLKSGWLFM